MPVDSAVWTTLAFVLTVIGAAWTWRRWHREGLPGATRGAAWTLLPIAALLTGTLRLGGEVVDAVSRWAARLVFNPFTWVGIILAGVSVVLFGASAALAKRGLGVRERPAKVKRTRAKGATPQVGPAPPTAAIIDDEVAAILKKHGIR